MVADGTCATTIFRTRRDVLAVDVEDDIAVDDMDDDDDDGADDDADDDDDDEVRDEFGILFMNGLRRCSLSIFRK